MNFDIQIIASTVFWVAASILSVMSLMWAYKEIWPRVKESARILFGKARSLYFNLHEQSYDTSRLAREAKEAWLETSKRNESMFDKRDRSRAYGSFLEAEHEELTYYLALKGKASKKEKERLREIRRRIERVNNA